MPYRGLGAAILVGGLLAAVQVLAADPATYSTGKSGSQLKWLAAKEAKPAKSDSAVTPTQYAEPQQPPADLPSEPVPASPSDNGTSQKSTVPLPSDALPRTVPSKPKSAKSAPNTSPSAPPKQNPYYSPDGLLPLERENGANPRGLFKESCPSPKDLKHIADLSTNITPPEGDLPHDCPLGNDPFVARNFAPITFSWNASGLCHKPLYFEDVQLERYGHMCGPWLQPFASAGQFFVTIPFLPYKMGLEPPNECIYTLGYYRPGDCAPYMIDPIPISVRAALFEGAAIVGCGFAFP